MRDNFSYKKHMVCSRAWALSTQLYLTQESYSAFQIDELHRHNQSFVGTLHATSLLWYANMKTAVKALYK